MQYFIDQSIIYFFFICFLTISFYYSMAVSFIGIAAIIKLALNHLKLVLSVYSFTFLSPFSHSHC